MVLIGLALALGTVGAALAVAPRPTDTGEKGAYAADRLVVALSLPCAVVYATVAGGLIEMMSRFGALKDAAPGEGVGAVATFEQSARIGFDAALVGLPGVVAAVVLGVWIVGAEMEGLRTRRFCWEAALCGLLILGPVVTSWRASTRIEEFAGPVADKLRSIDRLESEKPQGDD